MKKKEKDEAKEKEKQKEKALKLSNYRTEFIAMPEDTYILGASMKIVETNPGQVRAEKILSVWNDNKEAARTIINYFVPKEKEEADAKTPKEEPKAEVKDGTGTVSSGTSGSTEQKKSDKK